MSIWSGVYSTFCQDTSCEANFAHPIWLSRSIDRLHAARNFGSSPTKGLTTVDLGTLLGVIIAEANQGAVPVTVHDVGGNLGQSYFVSSAILPTIELCWNVVERADFLDGAGNILPSNPGLSFTTFWPPPQDRRGVVHFGSSLQYFLDWQSVLTESSFADWIVLSDLPAGDGISTFASRQRYYEGHLDCWFFALQDVTQHMADLGYELEVRRPFFSPTNPPYFPENALPEELRINFSLDLAYRKSKK